MLNTLKKIFSSNNENSMSFYRFHSKLVEWREKKTYPYEYELPDTITLPSDFWKQVTQLYKSTKADGKERAISVFWVDGELVVTSVVKGTSSQVTPKGKVSVKYVPSRKQGYYTKEVYVDEKRYSKRDVYHKKIPKKISVEYLFNMHTHPPHQIGDRVVYSFFSLQDLHSLLASGAVVTGMISDKLWLLFRTNKSPKVLNNFEEREITEESLTERLHISVYSAQFNQKLRRFLPKPVENQPTV